MQQAACCYKRITSSGNVSDVTIKHPVWLPLFDKQIYYESLCYCRRPKSDSLNGIATELLLARVSPLMVEVTRLLNASKTAASSSFL